MPLGPGDKMETQCRIIFKECNTSCDSDNDCGRYIKS